MTTIFERPNDPATGLAAGADELAGLGDVVPARDLPFGDEEVDALAGLGDPHRRFGPATKVIRKAALGAELGFLRPRHGVIVELALCALLRLVVFDLGST